MITCPKCKKELSDGTRFCDSCGAQIFETFFCPNCGKQTNSEFAFCQNCGASIAEDPVKEQTAVAPTRKKKLSKKVFIFGGIGVAVIAFLVPVLVLIPVLVIFLFSGRGEKVENNFTLYLKDSEIFFTDLKEGSEAWQLSRRLVAIDEYEIDNELLAYVGANYGDLVHINETANLAFYPDKVSDDNIGLWSVENFSLYYRPIDNAEVEAVKIDSSIVSYTVNDSATIVTYLKGEEGTLYQYKVGEDAKVKIASDVKGFEVSDDGTKIGYINSEGSLYLKYAEVAI